MDLMIDSTYNNTIAGKYQLRVRDVSTYVKKHFLEKEVVFGLIFPPTKMCYFPVTLAELCVDLCFIMSLKEVGVSLKKAEVVRVFMGLIFKNA